MNYGAVPGWWVADAACKGDTASMALPERAGRQGPTIQARFLRLRERCLACPVYDQCREWALTKPDPAPGMYAAGMTESERERMRRRYAS